MRVDEFAVPDEPIGDAVYRWLEVGVLTEENTDKLIDLAMPLLPKRVWLIPLPGFLVRKLLDLILPGTALAIMRAALK